MKSENSVSKLKASSNHGTGKAGNDSLEPKKVHYRFSDGTPSALNDAGTPGTPARHPFDLEERTARFGESIIRFGKKIPRGPGNDRLIDQLVGCGASVGANYCEANGHASKKDFIYSISRCKKEAHEAKFFLRMIAAAEPPLADDARLLYREANELHLIFASIFRKGRSNSK